MDNLEKPCYDYKGISGVLGYLKEMTAGLNGLGYGVYQSDHEDGSGQYEINFDYSDALTTADRYTFFKMMTSQVARKARSNRDAHAQAVCRQDWKRGTHPLPRCGCEVG